MKIKAKWIKYVSVIPETIKFLKETIGGGGGNFLTLVFAMTSWIWYQKYRKKKNRQVGLYPSGKMERKQQTTVKQHAMEWEKIHANPPSNGGTIPNINIYFNSTATPPIIQLENGQSACVYISPKEAYRWPPGVWKGVQYPQSSRKSRSKPQWDITSCLLGW